MMTHDIILVHFIVVGPMDNVKVKAIRSIRTKRFENLLLSIAYLTHGEEIMHELCWFNFLQSILVVIIFFIVGFLTWSKFKWMYIGMQISSPRCLWRNSIKSQLPLSMWSWRSNGWSGGTQVSLLSSFPPPNVEEKPLEHFLICVLLWAQVYWTSLSEEFVRLYVLIFMTMRCCLLFMFKYWVFR